MANTHEVVITLTSTDDNTDVSMQVEWNPRLTDDQIEELGYTPPAYTVAERFIMTVMEMITATHFMEEDNPRTLN